MASISDNQDKMRGLMPQMFADTLMTDEDFIMDLSDTLFSSLNQPFAFPNPKEMCT